MEREKLTFLDQRWEILAPGRKKKNDEPERTTACETLGIPVLHLQDGHTIEPPSGSSVEN